MNDFLIYLLILSGSTYLIRAIPFVAVKKNITNRYIKSFLYYIPFSVLVAMTIPSAIYATGNVISSIAGLIVGGIFAYRGKGLTVVAIISCVSAFLVECIMLLF
ncbi:MAG: AzlD domain-containing protein [Clostridia bacterium]|nr:AzlD domain-containing protein [Clostridia bacterium]